MAAPFESLNKNIVKRTGFVATGLYWTWNETQRVNNYKPTDDATTFLLRDAYDNLDESIAPTVGSKHGSISGAYCTGCTVDAQDAEDPVNLDITSSWIEEGQCSEVSYDIYQLTEVSNFAVNPDSGAQNVLTSVVYTPKNGGPSINFGVGKFVADIRVPRILKAIRIRQYETNGGSDSAHLGSPAEIMDTVFPFWNSDDVWGFGAGDLLYIGKKSQSVMGTPIYDTTHTILYNERGWHHFYSIWKDARGLVPGDGSIKPIDPATVRPTDGNLTAIDGDSGDPHNGVAAFVMLESESFTDYANLANLKPPFKTS